MTILQSGELYIVRRGDYGRLVDTDDDSVAPPMPILSMFAHVQTDEPWTEVPAEEVPPLVRKIADVEFPAPAMLAE